MIEIKNIEKSFGESKVLKGVSSIFETGKTNLIIGQSGSGKTVLLKSLLGIFSPDAGTIDFDGRIYANLSENEKRELRTEIGMVFQGSALFDGMTVEENIGFPLKMFTNKSNAEIKERANFVINRVNLINANHKKPSEISGGMQKRVAIARAIVNNPKYLFCDEPNSGLDPKTATVIDNLIQEITKEYNITTVINTHDMNSVMEIGEKIIFLKEGILAWEGSKKEIFKTDNAAIMDFVYSSNLFKKIRKAQNKEE
jgi:phospholipid/cholesterol/gamma-HCH transport system ATP-binding protein